MTQATIEPIGCVDAEAACRRVQRILENWRGREGVIIFGAGAHTQKTLPALLAHASRVAGIVDDSPARWGDRVGVWTVRDPGELIGERSRGILVSSDSQHETLAARLLSAYGDEHVILPLYDQPTRPSDEPSLAFTGERQVGRTLEEIEIGHRARYYWALQHIKHGERALDAACGNGYGSRILAQGGARVLGVDIAKDAIAFANYHYGGKDVSFATGRLDGGETLARIGAEHGPFDAVVSMETIEHLEQPRGFLSSAFSLLKPGGKLLCSTPNAETMPIDKVPFHRAHLSARAATKLLRSIGFSSLRWFGQEGMQILCGRSLASQRYCLYSAIKPHACQDVR